MKYFLSMALTLCTFVAFSQSPIGVWKTIDDETKEEKSNVTIYEQDGKLYGKITKILSAEPDTVCDKCPGDKKNKPVMGLVIIEDMKQDDGYWKKGKILDPESGSVYGCSIWFEDGVTDQLKVRGKHWTGLYRTQTWHRVK
ncbi:MAG: DUF2147 domain-containing protein [Bacteroidota bacterium]